MQLAPTITPINIDFKVFYDFMSYFKSKFLISGKQIPDAFLRRCFFHYIQFPSREDMEKIIAVHHPDVKQDLLREALELFFGLRELNGLKKKPSTSELIDWLKLLIADDVSQQVLMDKSTDVVPLFGALLKNEQDVQLLEKLAFMSRRQR